MSWLLTTMAQDDGTTLYLLGIRVWKRRFIITWNLS